MNFRSSGVAICLLAAMTASCATASATTTSGAVTARTSARSSCHHPPNDVLTLASNGKTYCIRVGERFDVYLRGTVSSRWLEPLASNNVIKGVPNGALSLVAGLTGASFAGARPGRVLITSIRPPCPGWINQKNKFEPNDTLPKTYPLGVCPPLRRFSVSIIVLR